MSSQTIRQFREETQQPIFPSKETPPEVDKTSARRGVPLD
jgi:hypothetical protein